VKSSQLVISQSEAQGPPQTWTIGHHAKLAVCTAALLAIAFVVGLLVGVSYKTVSESATLTDREDLVDQAQL
jgi:hypothetical protein